MNVYKSNKITQAQKGVTNSNENGREVYGFTVKHLPPLVKKKASEPDLNNAFSRSYTREKQYLG